MVTEQLDLASLASRISQLEQQQVVLKKYVVGLKRQIDDINQRFNIKYDNLQASKASKISITANSENLSDIDSINQAIERLNQQIEASPERTSQVELSETAIQNQTNSVIVDNDDPTQNKAFDDSTEATEEPAVSVEEFLKRYEEGERDFIGINLAGTDLSQKTLCMINLNEANLQSSNLSVTNLDDADLIEVNFVNANLNKAGLRSAKLLDANLSEATLKEASLEGANLTGSNLIGTNLTKANLYMTNLTTAIINEANLTQATLSYANLTTASLKGSNLSSAN